MKAVNYNSKPVGTIQHHSYTHDNQYGDTMTVWLDNGKPFQLSVHLDKEHTKVVGTHMIYHPSGRTNIKYFPTGCSNGDVLIETYAEDLAAAIPGYKRLVAADKQALVDRAIAVTQLIQVVEADSKCIKLLDVTIGKDIKSKKDQATINKALNKMQKIVEKMDGADYITANKVSQIAFRKRLGLNN